LLDSLHLEIFSLPKCRQVVVEGENQVNLRIVHVIVRLGSVKEQDLVVQTDEDVALQVNFQSVVGEAVVLVAVAVAVEVGVGTEDITDIKGQDLEIRELHAPDQDLGKKESRVVDPEVRTRASRRGVSVHIITNLETLFSHLHLLVDSCHHHR